MGGGSSPGDKSVTKRYAPYVESYHSNFLGTIALQRDAVIYDSPFADYDFVDVSNAFFGMGYVIGNFPSLFDMFGKFMSGLDLEVLWSTSFNRVTGKPEIDIAVSKEIELADDKMVKGDLAEFQVDMRNMNAVPSSSFIIGKAVMEDKRLKVIAKISLDIKERLLSEVGKEYTSFLNWEKKTVATYAEIMKAYFIHESEIDNVNYTFASKDTLWPLAILSHEGQALGTMQGIAGYKHLAVKRKRSDISKVLLVASYAVTGAIIGTQIGGYVGAIVGAVVGFIVGIAAVLFE